MDRGRIPYQDFLGIFAKGKRASDRNAIVAVTGDREARLRLHTAGGN